MKKALICGLSPAGRDCRAPVGSLRRSFDYAQDRLRTSIGGHLVKKLKREGYWVRAVDIKEHEFAPTQADEFRLLDLRNGPALCAAQVAVSGRAIG